MSPDEKLASSGISDKQAKELGIASHPSAAKLDKQFQNLSCLQLKYFGVNGEDVGFYRVRYLELPKGFAGKVEKPQRYAQLKDALNWVYLPKLKGLDWAAIAADASKALLITEGELKAACACIHGFPTIALGGVTMWRSAKKNIDLLPPLSEFNWKGRQVTIVFDSDAATNPQVAAASVALAKRLIYEGALVSIASLPVAFDGAKQGLDDFLVAGMDLRSVLDDPRPLQLGEQLAQLNEAYAYVTQQDVIVDLKSANRIKRDSFINGMHANMKTVQYTQLANGSNKRVEIDTPREWLSWPARRDVSSVIYAPGQPRITENGEFNSWKSWGCEPQEGDVKPWHGMLDYIFSESNEYRYWFEQWCAAPFQEPGLKLYTACMFWGPETGTGKSLLGITLGRLYGQDNFTIVENSDLFANFNEWASNKQFVLGDEISGSDKRSEADKLKALITRPKVRINMKHLPTYEVIDCINYFFTSNHCDSLFLEDKDRRNFIHRMPSKVMPRKFYTDFLDWLDKKGGKEALLDYFLNLDLTGFDAQGPAPMTQAKMEMIDHAKSDVSAFVQDLQRNIDEMQLLLRTTFMLKEKPDIVLSKHLLALYDPEGRTRVTSRGIGRALAASSLKTIFVNRTEAFGTQRFYILCNEEKWLTAQPEEVRSYIDSIYKAGTTTRKEKF